MATCIPRHVNDEDDINNYSIFIGINLLKKVDVLQRKTIFTLCLLLNAKKADVLGAVVVIIIIPDTTLTIQTDIVCNYKNI